MTIDNDQQTYFVNELNITDNFIKEQIVSIATSNEYTVLLRTDYDLYSNRLLVYTKSLVLLSEISINSRLYGGLYKIEFVKDQLYCVTFGGYLLLIDLFNLKPKKILRITNAPIYCLTQYKDSVLCGADNGSIYLVDVNNFEIVRRLNYENDKVMQIVTTGGLMIAAHYNGTIVVVNMLENYELKTKIRTIFQTRSKITTLISTRDVILIGVGSFVEIYNIFTGELLQKVCAHQEQILAMEITEEKDGQDTICNVFTSGIDGIVNMFSFKNNRLMLIKQRDNLKYMDCLVIRADKQPSQNLLLIGGRDGVLTTVKVKYFASQVKKDYIELEGIDKKILTINSKRIVFVQYADRVEIFKLKNTEKLCCKVQNEKAILKNMTHMVGLIDAKEEFDRNIVMMHLSADGRFIALLLDDHSRLVVFRLEYNLNNEDNQNISSEKIHCVQIFKNTRKMLDTIKCDILVDTNLMNNVLTKKGDKDEFELITNKNLNIQTTKYFADNVRFIQFLDHDILMIVFTNNLIIYMQITNPGYIIKHADMSFVNKSENLYITSIKPNSNSIALVRNNENKIFVYDLKSKQVKTEFPYMNTNSIIEMAITDDNIITVVEITNKSAKITKYEYINNNLKEFVAHTNIETSRQKIVNIVKNTREESIITIGNQIHRVSKTQLLTSQPNQELIYKMEIMNNNEIIMFNITETDRLNRLKYKACYRKVYGA